MKETCNMCLVVLEGEHSQREKEEYCNFCFQEGRLVYVRDNIHDFRRRYFEKKYAVGASDFVARFHTLLIGFAPYWKEKRGL
jgi:predicted amidohydrolase